MNKSTFRLQLELPLRIEVQGRQLAREDFFGWLWQSYTERGLLGVHEGTLLSEQAAEQGFETESFTVDAAEAPRERDWISRQKLALVELYFASLDEARKARTELAAWVSVGEVFEQKEEDWDADWKRSFLNSSEGVRVPPFWRILPAWTERVLGPDERAIKINPGAGFGTGTHETTQLCLQAIGEFALKTGSSLTGVFHDLRVLDFGSGSGILAIGAALLGAQVAAVEIDELAVDNARENARLNGVAEKIVFSRSLDSNPERHPLVIANILRPVLVQFAPELVARLVPQGRLVLSGLVEKDIEEVSRVFSALLGSTPRVTELGEWRSLVW